MKAPLRSEDEFCHCGKLAVRGPYCTFHALEWLIPRGHNQ